MPQGPLQVVVFHLSGQRYAVPAAQIVELARAVAPTPVPNAPPLVEGVIDFHGAIIPLLDIRQRFGLPPESLTESEHLIIARSGRRVVALRTDGISDVVTIDSTSIADLDLPTKKGSPRGVARLSDGLVLIQDMETFLSDEEAADVDNALARFERRTPSP